MRNSQGRAAEPETAYKAPTARQNEGYQAEVAATARVRTEVLSISSVAPMLSRLLEIKTQVRFCLAALSGSTDSLAALESCSPVSGVLQLRARGVRNYPSVTQLYGAGSV